MLVWSFGSYEFQVGRLVDAMFAAGIIDKQRQDAYKVIDIVFGLKDSDRDALQHTDSKSKCKERLITGINKNFSHEPDKMAAFLGAVNNKSVELPPDNPLKIYKSLKKNVIPGSS